MAKILLLGGTGAMGVYLVPELLNLGHDVFVTSRSERKSDNNKLNYLKGSAHDNLFLTKILTDKYDAIVDFMVYTTEEFRQKYELLLLNTEHYIFLSTYRVFAESSVPITENSRKLLEVSKNSEYLATDEYALTKARQENVLRESKYKNWTIIRPTITYSKTRFQLGTLEASTVIVRSIHNCPVILPQEMLDKQTTMTWAGDVAKMIARLILNQNAFCEEYNACTAEHRSWKEVAEYYKKLIGLNVVPVSIDTYIKVIGGKYQILYDRMFNRIMDNSKILKAIGMKQNELMPLFDGLAKELSNKYSLESIKMDNWRIHHKMDKITHTSLSKREYFICLFSLFKEKLRKYLF